MPQPQPAQRLKIEGIKGIWVGGPKEKGKGGEDGLAVWIGERKGAPGSLRLWGLGSLKVDEPRAVKTFYKADKIVLKWNDDGSMVGFNRLHCS